MDTFELSIQNDIIIGYTTVYCFVCNHNTESIWKNAILFFIMNKIGNCGINHGPISHVYCNINSIQIPAATHTVNRR